jgi:Mlc titration factor MtfA (ptsG expression regulator)
LPLLDHSSEEERNRLRRLAILLLHEKSFVGAHNFNVSEDRMGFW